MAERAAYLVDEVLKELARLGGAGGAAPPSGFAWGRPWGVALVWPAGG